MSWSVGFEGTIKYTMKVSGLDAAKAGTLFPSGFELSIKGSNAHVKTNGGAMASNIIYNGTTSQNYMLNHKLKIAYIVPNNTSPTTQSTVEKTKERKMILGFNCTKYLIKDLSDNQEVVTTVWATSEIANPLPKSESGKSMGNFSFSNIDGTPLVISTLSGGYTMEIMAVSLEKKELPDTLFNVPAGYVQKPLDTSK